jgi:Zn-dependent peptidase ImmA (M78 family)
VSSGDNGQPETLRYSTVLKRDPQEIARQVLLQCDQRGPPADIYQILRHFNIQVVPETLEGDGYLIEMWDGSAEVLISTKTQPTLRWKFTAAHELGHWLVNRFTEIKGLASSSVREAGHDEIEKWCNNLASCVLVPSIWLTKYVGRFENLKRWRIVVEGPAKFGVSREFFQTRLSQVYRIAMVDYDMHNNSPLVRSVIPRRLMKNGEAFQNKLNGLPRKEVEGKHTIGPLEVGIEGKKLQAIYTNCKISEPVITEYAEYAY